MQLKRSYSSCGRGRGDGECFNLKLKAHMSVSIIYSFQKFIQIIDAYLEQLFLSGLNHKYRILQKDVLKMVYLY